MSADSRRSQQQRERSDLFDGDFGRSGQTVLDGDATVAFRMDRQLHAYSSIANLICGSQDGGVDRSVLCPRETIEPKTSGLAGTDYADSGRRRELSNRNKAAAGHDDAEPVTGADEGTRTEYGNLAKTS